MRSISWVKLVVVLTLLAAVSWYVMDAPRESQAAKPRIFQYYTVTAFYNPDRTLKGYGVEYQLIPGTPPITARVKDVHELRRYIKRNLGI